MFELLKNVYSFNTWMNTNEYMHRTIDCCHSFTIHQQMSNNLKTKASSKRYSSHDLTITIFQSIRLCNFCLNLSWNEPKFNLKILPVNRYIKDQQSNDEIKVFSPSLKHMTKKLRRLVITADDNRHSWLFGGKITRFSYEFHTFSESWIWMEV